MDPLSLLTRLCAAVPPLRSHKVKYAGVLASACKLRARLLPKRAKDLSAEGIAEESARDG